MYEFVIIFLLALGVIGWLMSRKRKVIRSVSRDRAAHEATRVPVTDKCACGKPRCRYKGKKHPSAVPHEAPLRNGYHRRGGPRNGR